MGVDPRAVRWGRGNRAEIYLSTPRPYRENRHGAATPTGSFYLPAAPATVVSTLTPPLRGRLVCDELSKDGIAMRTLRSQIATSALALALLGLCAAAPGLGQVAPSLGAAEPYTALGVSSIPTSGTVTCTNSTIDGDVGTTFTSITQTSCTVTGTIDAPVDGAVVTDFNTAYSDLDSQNPICDGTIPTTSTTLPPGVYCSAAGTTIGAGVILTLDGDADDVWVFKVGTGGLGAFTGTDFSVVMGGTAEACNVYWWTAEALSLTRSTFVGTVLSGAAVTMTDGLWTGRAMASTDVTFTDSTITGCSPTVAPQPPPTAIPTLGGVAIVVLVALLAGLGLIVLRRPAARASVTADPAPRRTRPVEPGS